MDLDKPSQQYRPGPTRRPPRPYEGGEGCLTVAVRIPVRIVVLLIVLPVRMVWDVLAAGSRLLGRAIGRLCHVLIAVPLVWLYETLLTPLGHGVVWICRDVLAPVGRAVGVASVWLYEALLTPLGRAAVWLAAALLVWPWVALWRYVLVPVVYYGLVVPVVWICRDVFAPVGRAVGRAVGAALAWFYEVLLAPLGRGVVWLVVAVWRYALVPVVYYGLVVPVAWTYRGVLTPIGHGISWVLAAVGQGLAAVGGGLVATARVVRAAVVWLVFVLLVAPVGWLYRKILVPVAREIGAAFAFGWRVAGFVSRAVGRAIAWLAWNAVGRPVRWTYQYVCTPVGHWVRRNVLAPAKAAALAAGRAARDALSLARQTVRQARKDAWRALAGPPRVREPREPNGDLTRTLGSTTTVPGAVPAPEVSLSDQG